MDFRPFHQLLKRFESSRAPLFLRHKFAHRSALQTFQTLQHFPRICRTFRRARVPHSLQAARHKPVLTARSPLSRKQSYCSGVFKHNLSFGFGAQVSRSPSQGCVRNLRGGCGAEERYFPVTALTPNDNTAFVY